VLFSRFHAERPCQEKHRVCRWSSPSENRMFTTEAIMSEVEIFSDKSQLVRAETERIVTLAKDAIGTRGRCLVALSGGSTPRPLYELLATAPYAARIDWPRTHLFWGDERCVPPDHPDSNHRMTREALIDHVPLPPENVHRIRGEDPPDQAAGSWASYVM
jgi:6-phosphogluconolactonase